MEISIIDIERLYDNRWLFLVNKLNTYFNRSKYQLSISRFSVWHLNLSYKSTPKMLFLQNTCKTKIQWSYSGYNISMGTIGLMYIKTQGGFFLLGSLFSYTVYLRNFCHYVWACVIKMHVRWFPNRQNFTYVYAVERWPNFVHDVTL